MKTFIHIALLIPIFYSCEAGKKKPRFEIDTSIFREMLPLTKPDSLAKMLPAEILSYKAKTEPARKELDDSLPGMVRQHWTSASQNYILRNDTIKVELTDFKLTPSYYQIYSNLWEGREGDIEDTVHTCEYVAYGPHVDAWIVYDKKFNNTMAYISSRNRYYMTYECKGKHMQFMKEAASRFDYSNF